MRTHLIAIAMIVACSSKSPPPATPPTSTPIADAGTVVMVDAAMIDARPAPTIPVDAAVVAVVTGCPITLTSPSSGNCKLGTDCPYKDGRCFCDGYHGGIPPREGVDYSHWVCGKTKGRQDGCPDQIRAGAACRTAGKFCHPQEGMWCGPQFECANGHWEARVNDCETIPRAPH